MSIHIRSITPNDWEFFSELDFLSTWESLPLKERQANEASSLRATVQSDNINLLTNTDSTIFIAETSQGALAGIIWLGQKKNSLTGQFEAWIYNLHVAAAFRKTGIAKALISHAEQWALARGYTSIGLMVASHNTIAKELYEKFSFSSDYIIMRRKVA